MVPGGSRPTRQTRRRGPWASLRLIFRDMGGRSPHIMRWKTWRDQAEKFRLFWGAFGPTLARRVRQEMVPQQPREEEPLEFGPEAPKEIGGIPGSWLAPTLFIRHDEKGVFRRGFLQNGRLSSLWRSECQMYCWVLGILLSWA